MSVLSAPEASPPHLAWIAERLRQVTVEIHTEAGGGAGILWAADLVVTNARVARASWARVGLTDDRHVDARLVIADRRADLALLRMPRSEVAPAPSPIPTRCASAPSSSPSAIRSVCDARSRPVSCTRWRRRDRADGAGSMQTCAWPRGTPAVPSPIPRAGWWGSTR